jgi:hypothetical protein
MKQDPMQEWVLRDELLAAFHRWPMIVLFALVGTLLGLAFAYLWPASYRANVEVSVELNPYRVLDDQYIPEFAGAEFRNIDDYKHWQMLQLSIVVLSDPYMLETVTRLREKDAEWEAISPQDLREMLSANWRNAGRWHLSANTSTARQSVEAVETWREVVIDLTQESIAISRDLFRLELVMRSLNDELVEFQLQQTTLEALQGDTAEILDNFISKPENEIITEAERMELFAHATQMTDLLPGGQAIINSFPQAGAAIDEYAVWLEGVNLMLERELESIQLRIAEIQDKLSQVRSEWEESLVKARGLSATLNLENLQKDNTRVEEIRSYSLAALIGALLGLLAWIIVFLVQITRKGYR